MGAVIGVTKERGQDGERGGVSEDSAEGDSRRLDRWEIWMREISAWFLVANNVMQEKCCEAEIFEVELSSL